MAWEYTEKTKQLFVDAMSSKGNTHLGTIENPDGEGMDGSIVCGDALKLYFLVEKSASDPLQDRITEIKYETFGCTSAIASSEALCLLIEERKCTPIEALKITNQDIVDFLGGLPSQKIHCSVMGEQALQDAVKDWAKKRGVDLKSVGVSELHEEDDEGRIVCKCYNLTEPFLIRKIKELSLKNVDDVVNATKAGGACGVCQFGPGGISDLIKEVWKIETIEGEQQADYSVDLRESIEKITSEIIRPILKQHGGDMTIVEVKGYKVFCALRGSCSSCPGSRQTLKNVVEKKYKELIHEDITVIDV